MEQAEISLTAVEEEALRSEAARVAALGAAWEPSEENLREVVEAVKAASSRERREAHRAGIAAARGRGVRLGRPKKEIPGSFPELVREIEEGHMTRVAAARELGVSSETLRRWMADQA